MRGLLASCAFLSCASEGVTVASAAREHRAILEPESCIACVERFDFYETSDVDDVTAVDANELLRAFDAKTGRELWQGRLPSSVQATPMTYERHGRQFVVVAVGGQRQANTPITDSIVAFALPLPNESGPTLWSRTIDRPGGRFKVKVTLLLVLLGSASYAVVRATMRRRRLNFPDSDGNEHDSRASVGKAPRGPPCPAAHSYVLYVTSPDGQASRAIDGDGSSVLLVCTELTDTAITCSVSNKGYCRADFCITACRGCVDRMRVHPTHAPSRYALSETRSRCAASDQRGLARAGGFDRRRSVRRQPASPCCRTARCSPRW